MKLNLRQRLFFAEYFYILIFGIIFFILFSIIVKRFSPQGRNTFTEGKPALIILLLIVGMFIIWAVTRTILISRALENRRKKLAVKVFELQMKPQQFALSETMRLISKETPAISNFYLTDDWGFCDYEFSMYRRSKYGKYKARTYYYAIAAFQLPRKLPNVFFDGNVSGKHEFKLLFDNSQVHSLEGNFDKFFKTYFHNDYTIDNLSFITPEVMQAIIDASEYDIEIYGDKLYLYNELELMPNQLLDMEKKGKAIRQKLLNNINTYRDERISYDEGRRTVSVLGFNLKQSLTISYLKLIVGVVLSSAGLYFAPKVGSFGTYAFIIGVTMMFKSALKIYTVKTNNKYANLNKSRAA
jgi:hypothetical protein